MTRPLSLAALLLVAACDQGVESEAPAEAPAEATPAEAASAEAATTEAPSCDVEGLPAVDAGGSRIAVEGDINGEPVSLRCDFAKPRGDRTRLTVVSRGDGDGGLLPSYHVECYAPSGDPHLSFWMSGVTGAGVLQQKDVWSENDNLSLDFKSGEKMLRTTSMMAPENPNMASLEARVTQHESVDNQNRVVGCLVGSWTEDGMNSFGSVRAAFDLQVAVPQPVDPAEVEEPPE